MLGHRFEAGLEQRRDNGTAAHRVLAARILDHAFD